MNFNHKIRRSTQLQTRLQEDIDREKYELTNIFNKLESSSCYGKVCVSLNFIASKEYTSPKVMLNKEHLNIYNKFQNYKLKFTNAFALLTEDYFEFYQDSQLEKELLKIPTKTMDVVALGIRTLNKPQAEPTVQRKTVVKRRAMVFGEQQEEDSKSSLQPPGVILRHGEKRASQLIENPKPVLKKEGTKGIQV